MRKTARSNSRLLLSIPCLAAFLVIPDLLMRALFMRGAFTAADAAAAGHTLAAYALGLLPFVLIRSVVATFFARGDTATPVKAALAAAAVNIAFKILLMGPLAQVGPRAGDFDRRLDQSHAGGLVSWRAGYGGIDIRLRQSAPQLAVAGVVLALVLWFGAGPVSHLFDEGHSFRNVATVGVLVLIGGVVYGGGIAMIFGPRWWQAFRRG